jgi:hypothetical protein
MSAFNRHLNDGEMLFHDTLVSIISSVNTDKLTFITENILSITTFSAGIVDHYNLISVVCEFAQSFINFVLKFIHNNNRQR